MTSVTMTSPIDQDKRQLTVGLSLGFLPPSVLSFIGSRWVKVNVLNTFFEGFGPPAQAGWLLCWKEPPAARCVWAGLAERTRPLSCLRPEQGIEKRVGGF